MPARPLRPLAGRRRRPRRSLGAQRARPRRAAPGERSPEGPPMSTAPVAAIDCGTNSVRLLVSQDGRSTLERLMRITRLGQGVDRTGRLAPAAIERTVAVLREYREVMDGFGVGRVRMTATSAARD